MKCNQLIFIFSLINLSLESDEKSKNNHNTHFEKENFHGKNLPSINPKLKKRQVTTLNHSQSRISLSHNNVTDSNEKSQLIPINHFENSEYFEYFYEQEKFFYVRNIQCTKTNCPEPSNCIDAFTCKCGSGYANLYLPQTPVGYSYCSYKQKYNLIAFLLELILPCGAGHFYSGRYTAGSLKLALVFFPFQIALCIYCLNFKRTHEKGFNQSEDYQNVMIIFICTVLILSIWQLIDIVNYATNSYKDGHKVPLY
jgi:hypothetical protein